MRPHRSDSRVNCYSVETPVFSWSIAPQHSGRFSLKRRRMEHEAGPRSPMHAVGAWIPVDTFWSPEEAAVAVAERKTGVMEWDLSRDPYATPLASLAAWRTEQVENARQPAPPLAEKVKAALGRLRPRYN